jgi:hypothetical protein
MIFVSRNTEEMPDFISIKKEMKFLLKKLIYLTRRNGIVLKNS